MSGDCGRILDDGEYCTRPAFKQEGPKRTCKECYDAMMKRVCARQHAAIEAMKAKAQGV